jgi:DNA-binding NarL/FixJ family response regulator/polyhydroxyalkanoate synthesis regulator phasin
MSNLGNLKALLIEPNPGMRVSLHGMLNQCGITKIEHALNSGTAIKAIQAKVFDLILCEYDLGVGQDGQQLLEDVRHHKLTPLSTIFIMVTAERAYSKVIGAAELAPNDYLLKPFNTDRLLERVSRAIEKRQIFLPVYNFIDNGKAREALDAAIEGAQSYPRYAVDFMRFQAEMLVLLGEAESAELLYQKLFDLKAVAWARLGLAKTLYMQGHYQASQEILLQLVADNDKFMDAYDWLAKTHEAIGELPEAQEVLNTAINVSPNAIRRLRKLGDIALQTGDIEKAEDVLKKVIGKAKFSEFRDPEDHVKLVDTLVKKGDTDGAKSIIRDMEKSMAGIQKTEACRAISAAKVHASTGDPRLKQELDAAVLANREDIGLSNDMKIGLAKSCLENNLDDSASEVILDVMRNSSNQTTLDKALDVFEKAGKAELGKELAQRSQQEVKELVAEGVAKAKGGDFRGSLDLMATAVRKSPENVQVILNASLSALKCLEHQGWDIAVANQARNFITAAAKHDPMNPRLKAMRALYDDLQKRYGIDAASSRIG